ncbi:sirohydrochlorin chelatase [Staphylococcus lutrae]|uniref:Sirohydrochlorin ferrochelatase n=1 Tax=Staphylococcus lutrae TaxID=155085 RepID=A0AAC9RRV6_9STAP|nr:CbiX/SirB N-terminal domain-containing protein [Staphylococcus lutrae]ARJ50554.1 sirohydrochlorin ferrochelatase [Staphylococcus lutrae]PNZ36340.1 sirohydrochlorin ferrochelatase [Staphylococcus lutrae]
MEKVILIVHGMRKGALNQTLTHFVTQLFENEAVDYELAFLESETVHLEAVIDMQVKAGATVVYLMPLLLFSASHYYEDIVNGKQIWEKRYPHVTFRLAQPLGTHPKMIDWVAQQIAHHQEQLTPKTCVIILAHGSHRYTQPAQALAIMARQLSTPDRPCYPCMVYGTYQYEQVLTEIAQQWDQLLIIPYFFYDGFLVQRTQQRILSLALPCTLTFTSAMNFHPVLKEVIFSRLVACKGGVECTRSS